MTRRGRDGGSATLYVMWIALTVLCVAAALVAVGLVGVARARAASAADLSALAAAAAVGTGREPCAAGAAVARRTSARVTACAVTADGVVTVDVELPLQGPMRRFGPARARARAGPEAVGAAPRGPH